jgi:hypothetical protein
LRRFSRRSENAFPSANRRAAHETSAARDAEPTGQRRRFTQRLVSPKDSEIRRSNRRRRHRNLILPAFSEPPPMRQAARDETDRPASINRSFNVESNMIRKLRTVAPAALACGMLAALLLMMSSDLTDGARRVVFGVATN